MTGTDSEKPSERSFGESLNRFANEMRELERNLAIKKMDALAQEYGKRGLENERAAILAAISLVSDEGADQ